MTAAPVYGVVVKFKGDKGKKCSAQHLRRLTESARTYLLTEGYETALSRDFKICPREIRCSLNRNGFANFVSSHFQPRTTLHAKETQPLSPQAQARLRRDESSPRHRGRTSFFDTLIENNENAF